MNWRLHCITRVWVHYLESTFCPTGADWSLSNPDTWEARKLRQHTQMATTSSLDRDRRTFVGGSTFIPVSCRAVTVAQIQDLTWCLSDSFIGLVVPHLSLPEEMSGNRKWFYRPLQNIRRLQNTAMSTSHWLSRCQVTGTTTTKTNTDPSPHGYAGHLRGRQPHKGPRPQYCTDQRPAPPPLPETTAGEGRGGREQWH